MRRVVEPGKKATDREISRVLAWVFANEVKARKYAVRPDELRQQFIHTTFELKRMKNTGNHRSDIKKEDITFFLKTVAAAEKRLAAEGFEHITVIEPDILSFARNYQPQNMLW